MPERRKKDKPKAQAPPHSCEGNRVSDGGGIDPRFEGKTWVITYRCGTCGRFMGCETERLD